MNDIDWLNLDARLLRVLVTTVQMASVSAAAVRLDLTQSAVSHSLDRLRAITGDPLFVKSGRGVVATARAQALALRAAELLRDLQGSRNTRASIQRAGRRPSPSRPTNSSAICCCPHSHATCTRWRPSSPCA